VVLSDLSTQTTQTSSQVHNYYKTDNRLQKTCRRCGESKPLDDSNFYKRKSARDGFYNICIACAKSETKDWKETLSEEQKYRYRRAEQSAIYGLTLEQFEEMVAAQANVCYLCGGTSQTGRKSDRHLSVDHNRKCCDRVGSCGKCVRKLLCTKCNSALGLVNDNIDLLKTMIAYLEDHSL
jgi:hypothetical protein